MAASSSASEKKLVTCHDEENDAYALTFERCDGVWRVAANELWKENGIMGSKAQGWQMDIHLQEYWNRGFATPPDAEPLQYAMLCYHPPRGEGL